MEESREVCCVVTDAAAVVATIAGIETAVVAVEIGLAALAVVPGLFWDWA